MANAKRLKMNITTAIFSIFLTLGLLSPLTIQAANGNNQIKDAAELKAKVDALKVGKNSCLEKNTAPLRETLLRLQAEGAISKGEFENIGHKLANFDKACRSGGFR